MFDSVRRKPASLPGNKGYCLTHDSTLFSNCLRATVLVCNENRTTPFDRFGQIMSRASQPGFISFQMLFRCFSKKQRNIQAIVGFFIQSK